MFTPSIVNFTEKNLSVGKNDGIFTQSSKMATSAVLSTVGTIGGVVESALLTLLSMPIRLAQFITPKSWTFIQDNFLVKGSDDALANTAKSASNFVRSVLGGIQQAEEVQETPQPAATLKERAIEKLQAAKATTFTAASNAKAYIRANAPIAASKARESMKNAGVSAFETIKANPKKTAAIATALTAGIAAYYFRDALYKEGFEAFYSVFSGRPVREVPVRVLTTDPLTNLSKYTTGFHNTIVEYPETFVRKFAEQLPSKEAAATFLADNKYYLVGVPTALITLGAAIKYKLFHKAGSLAKRATIATVNTLKPYATKQNAKRAAIAASVFASAAALFYFRETIAKALFSSKTLTDEAHLKHFDRLNGRTFTSSKEHADWYKLQTATSAVEDEPIISRIKNFFQA